MSLQERVDAPPHREQELQAEVTALQLKLDSSKEKELMLKVEHLQSLIDSSGTSKENEPLGEILRLQQLVSDVQTELRYRFNCLLLPDFNYCF